MLQFFVLECNLCCFQMFFEFAMQILAHIGKLSSIIRYNHMKSCIHKQSKIENFVLLQHLLFSSYLVAISVQSFLLLQFQNYFCNNMLQIFVLEGNLCCFQMLFEFGMQILAHIGISIQNYCL